jgi:hypothetical protein
VARDGDALLVPVSIGDKTYKCMLGTGAECSAYDTSFNLGDPIATIGANKVKLFAAPKTKLGGLPVHDGALPVMAFDLTMASKVCGERFHGVICMDFFVRHVVQIDFDAGEVRILKKADAACGQAFKVSMRDRVPRIRVQLDGAGEQEFRVGIGHVSMGSCDLTREQFDALVQKGGLKVVGASLTELAQGTSPSRTGRSKGLSLGDFVVQNPVLNELEDSMLTQAFWSRFLVTLDLGNGTIYLKKGKGFDRPDLYDLSGLHLLREEGVIHVNSVDRDSAAARQGIKAGDHILRVEAEPAEKTSMFQVRKLLAQPGETVHLTLQRGQTEMKVDLRLN